MDPFPPHNNPRKKTSDILHFHLRPILRLWQPDYSDSFTGLAGCKCKAILLGLPSSPFDKWFFAQPWY